MDLRTKKPLASLLTAVFCALCVSLALPQSATPQQALPRFEDARDVLDRSPRWEEWARVKAGDDTLNVWMVFPEREDQAPVVLVIHDERGLTDWVRAAADSLAASGFIAIAPDLLSGKSADGYGSAAIDPATIAEATRKLDQEEVHRRLTAVINHARALKTRTSVRAGIKAQNQVVPGSSGAVAILGFGWGAETGARLSAVQPEIQALVADSATATAGETPVLRLTSRTNAEEWRRALQFLKQHLEPGDRER